MKKCVFAGSFDPPTLGHKAIAEAGLALFDKVVVAITVNPEKQPTFSTEQRIEMWKRTLNSPRLKIRTCTTLVADLLREEGTDFYLRGIRSATDFDYETLSAYATKKVLPSLCPVYLPCPQELLHVSSSAVRTCLTFGYPLDGYVTEEVKKYILSLPVPIEKREDKE